MRNWFRKITLNPAERRIVGNVDKHGCHINGVFDPENSSPSFAYSIGFTRTLEKLGIVDAPEVIVFGLSGPEVGTIINGLLAMCSTGLDLTEGLVVDQFFGEYDCTIRMVHEGNITEEYLNSAIWYHRTQMGKELRSVAMLVWPDEDGRFPWEQGCADWVRADQPALYEPRLNS